MRVITINKRIQITELTIYRWQVRLKNWSVSEPWSYMKDWAEGAGNKPGQGKGVREQEQAGTQRNRNRVASLKAHRSRHPAKTQRQGGVAQEELDILQQSSSGGLISTSCWLLRHPLVDIGTTTCRSRNYNAINR